MVVYIKSDLEFILQQIKIAEAHAAGQPLYGAGGLIPSYNLAWGLRTVDGSYNHLLPGQEQWGAADQEFPELLEPDYRTVTVMMDPDGPGPSGQVPVSMPYTPGNDVDGPGTFASPGDVIDPEVRIISNLIVDQTLGNPAAILTALERAGVDDPGMVITGQISAAYTPLKPLFNALAEAERTEASAAAAAAASPGNAALQAAAAQAAADLQAARDALDAEDDALVALLDQNGIALDGNNLALTNVAPDEGLSASFNSWFTLFGQFFDHGLDLVNKGGNGTVMIPLMPDDPLYVEGSSTNFMVLTRATTSPGADGHLGDNPMTAGIDESLDDGRPVNTTTAYVDQNQTYTSHPSHQVFLRQYVATAEGPKATGNLIEGENGGMATWGELKAQSANMLGIEITDLDVGKVPLLRTDPYGNFIPNEDGYPQVIYGVGVDGIPNTSDDIVASGTADNPLDPSASITIGSETFAGAIRTNHAFLADIAHTAVPEGVEDGDIEIGLENPGNEPGVYDDELLDAHFIAGDGRANENIGLTAVHHVFHSEHNRLVEHTKETVLETGDLAFLNEWLEIEVAEVPVEQTAIDALVWDGERLFQAAKFGTEMQYQHLVFEEFARKVQPAINTFLVPDGFDTTMDPSIVAEFAHVVYRFGHSMLTETIDQYSADFVPNEISLIQGFLNPTAFTSTDGVDDGIAAGDIIRGMTRQVGNDIDEFVTSALRNNLLGLPLDLATINLARGRDTGVPSLNEARADFYEASNQNVLLKPYESWVDFAGHLKHEASIINFIAAYGTHELIEAETTTDGKRAAALAIILGTEQSVAVPGSEPEGITWVNSGGLLPGTGNDENPLVDDAFYFALYPDVAASGMDADTHYAQFGWSEGRIPNEFFDPVYYLANNPGAAGTNPLEHYATVGSAAGANPSANFDSARYLAENPDVAAAGMDPLTHFLVYGRYEGREYYPVAVAEERVIAPPEDRLDFLNATGAYAAEMEGSTLGGLNEVDLWIGGLAEETMPFGGMLGSTFNFVFEVQMELLQSGDRFYYLQRLDGLHLFSEMENNSFASMIMRNTDAEHLPSDVFSTPGLILEVDSTRQFNDLDGDGTLESDDPVGGGLLTQLVVRNDPGTPGTDTNYLKYNGDDHVLLGGTDAADTLIAGIGDDTLYGDGGNDWLDGGFGNDIINGGAGDDIIVDAGGDDNIKAGDGNDVVHAGPGLDLVLAGAGKDFVFLGTDEGSEVFAGEGDDFIYGNKNAERILGNEGNDWIETGTFDGAPGDNFDEIFAHDGIDGHDVFLGDGGFDEFIGEGGDDIMVGSPGRGKMAGMSGFDWVTYKDNTSGVNADISIPIIFDEAPVLPQNTALDEYQSMEGLSGTKFDDVLKGSEILAEERLPSAEGGQEGYRGSQLTKESIQLIAGLAAVVGLTQAQVDAMVAGQVVYNAGDIILGGDGSDDIQGNAGDDIIDGDKWLNVRISVRENIDGTGAEIETHNSMTTLASKMFSGEINPGQLVVVREILTDTTAGDIDTAVYRGQRTEYAFAATADGQLIVSHSVEDSLDGSDKLRNIERVEFADGNALNIIIGTPDNDTLDGTAQDDLILGLAGSDVLNGGAGNDILVGGPNGATTGGLYVDAFNTASLGNSNGTTNWAPDWVESNDSGGVTSGQIRIDDGNNNVLRFYGGAGQNGAEITRELDLSGATTATITYDYDADNLDGTEQVRVMFAANGVDYALLNTIDANDNGTGNHVVSGPFSATARIRFEVTGISSTDENVEINDLEIAFSAVETLNGGLGNDTYSFGLGDGNDVINEGVNATSGGTADRISILSTTIDPVSGLPVISALSANDSNTGTNSGDLVINYALPTGTQQTVTVAGHFNGTNAETGVELINFNNATYNGYLLGADDYAISRADPTGGNRTINLAASTVNNFVAGENGTEDTITGGIANDLIFGGSGDNDIVGGDGDDLLVGGGDDDSLDARTNGDPDNLEQVGALGADTMIGGGGNDTYGVDDLLDVVVEQVGGGTDTVETFMAAVSLETMANVENLEYLGGDADQFVGTGNAGNNTITGGDLNDTLSGLGGNDTLQGGLGADAMAGGEGNDTYIVDDLGDVVTEVAGAAGGIDTVESTVSYVLGADVENLELNGGDAINGTGNASNNTMTGNGAANQLFGSGGNDTLTGDDGNDLLDGGEGNDTISGGDDNDTIIGGAGNDTIDVGGGVNTIVYSTVGFGDDTINSFDNAGGTAANQDKIDLSGLGITAANFANRVFESTVGGAGNTLITIRENGAASAVQGTIRINGSNNASIDINDFTLASGSAPIGGATTGNNTLNGTTGNDTINALAGNDTVNGNAGNDTITGGPGNDFVNGNDGDDTFVWNANAAAPTDGRDEVDGGAEGGLGDTFVINGNASAETYRIYTRAAWDAVPGNIGGNLDNDTEIVVTRNGTDFNSVIAELWDIEEIRINGVDPSANGTAAGDTIEIHGDFSTTSLRPNTITIEGDTGDDTIDISALSSAHRIVFNSNGGHDTIIGTLRPEDVINLPAGAAIEDYVETTVDGVTTLTNGQNSITYTAEGEGPQTGPEEEEEIEPQPEPEPEEDEDTTPVPTTAGVIAGSSGVDNLIGTAAGDSILGQGGDDVVIGGDGNDDILGGTGADMLFGDAGKDRIFGGDGNDRIEGGEGGDTVFGEAGNDIIVAGEGDGNDTYYGDGMAGGDGNDTLDMSQIMASITADLGNGFNGRGSVSSADTGSDAIWSVENMIGGWGADTITASKAVNVMDGGGGDDIFRFLSADHANGDTIVDFKPGDKIDLSAMDASNDEAGNQGFTLVSGGFTGKGQLMVTTEVVDGEEYNVVLGNTTGGEEADFRLNVKSSHQLSENDFIV